MHPCSLRTHLRLSSSPSLLTLPEQCQQTICVCLSILLNFSLWTSLSLPISVAIFYMLCWSSSLIVSVCVSLVGGFVMILSFTEWEFHWAISNSKSSNHPCDSYWLTPTYGAQPAWYIWTSDHYCILWNANDCEWHFTTHSFPSDLKQDLLVETKSSLW